MKYGWVMALLLVTSCTSQPPIVSPALDPGIQAELDHINAQVTGLGDIITQLRTTGREWQTRAEEMEKLAKSRQHEIDVFNRELRGKTCVDTEYYINHVTLDTYPVIIDGKVGVRIPDTK